MQCNQIKFLVLMIIICNRYRLLRPLILLERQWYAEYCRILLSAWLCVCVYINSPFLTLLCLIFLAFWWYYIMMMKTILLLLRSLLPLQRYWWQPLYLPAVQLFRHAAHDVRWALVFLMEQVFNRRDGFECSGYNQQQNGWGLKDSDDV